MDVLSRLGKKLQHFRYTISRSEWGAKYLQLKKYAAPDHGVHSPGVLIIQIDGLGYEHLMHAIDRKKLPFLQRLIQRDNYVLRQFYSGLPSTTPAVQAELFYGVKCVIPAFKFFERSSAKEWAMFEAEAADRIASKLDAEHTGLLNGGSSYSNIFSGGAEEAPFCIQSMKLESIYHGIQLRRIAWFTLINFEKVFRIIGLTLLETGLAIFDCCKGILQRRNPFKEIKFILSRIGVCIGLREIIRVRVKIDIARGLPIIHANFVGYDEHSHRRNPDSAFALWTLKGIDATIRSLVKKAVRTEKRDYAVFIYSDHGQEASLPFPSFAGKTLYQAVQEVFATGKLANLEYADRENIIPHFNLHRRNTSLLRRSSGKNTENSQAKASTDGKIHITAMGPLGHIYLPVSLDEQWMRYYARQLVSEGAIPLVFFIEKDTVMCSSSIGITRVDDSAREIFGNDHPFLDDVVKDMKRLCRHTDAGDFVISGWRCDKQPLTFPVENGSHGGPGSRETRGFVILPDTLADDSRYLRPMDLRRKVRSVFIKKQPVQQNPSEQNSHTPRMLRVMSYNVHSCTGLDGKLFPERIARIIGRQAPDVVALQEVDRNMERSNHQDQLAIIAEVLGMHSCFFPVLQNGEEEYGLAVLSRYPMKVCDRMYLPRLSRQHKTERRGVLWVQLGTDHGTVHLLNTHLSLVRHERFGQMKHIIGEDMLGKIPPQEPVILCGDLNAPPSSPTHALLSEKLSDCQRLYSQRRADPTFFSSYPLLRLDHIFHSPQLAPVAIDVIDDWECRLASDHLPITATLHCASGMAN